jgi:hypothetical protein
MERCPIIAGILNDGMKYHGRNGGEAVFKSFLIEPNSISISFESEHSPAVMVVDALDERPPSPVSQKC